MTSQSSIVEKTSTLPNETIHITPSCVFHSHGHWNKVVPLMKPSILVDFNNDAMFRSCTCWLTNDIQRHHFPHWVSNYYIGNKDLVLSNHVDIGS
jgi:hypothetical protein